MTASSTRRKASQGDLARAAGVSISTVSRALSDSPGISSTMRHRIRDLADTLDYRPRTSSTITSHRIIVYFTLNRATGGLSQFYHDILTSLRLAADEAGLEIVLRVVADLAVAQERVGPEVDELEADAIFFLGVDPRPGLREWLIERRLVVVLVNGCDPLQQFSGVSPANFRGGYLAAQALLEAGHRAILHLTISERWTIQQRRRGFLAAIEQVEGALGDIRILSRGSTEAGENFIRELGATELRRYSAIFCYNDLLAAGVLQALETISIRVPDDISLIGFDDLSFAALFKPRLATMHVDRTELGREAVRLALAQLAEPERPPRQVAIAVHLIEGESIGAGPALNVRQASVERQPPRSIDG